MIILDLQTRSFEQAFEHLGAFKTINMAFRGPDGASEHEFHSK